MKKLLAQLVVFGTTMIMLISFTACGYPVDKFKSLEELQAVFPKDVYYFDFEQEGIKEAGRFEATKMELKDGDYLYFRYSIWYDIEYTINGQKQERKLRVAATDATLPMSFGYKSTEAFRSKLNQMYNSWFGTIEIGGIGGRTGLIFDENQKALLFSVREVDGYYCYYFALEGVVANFVEEEVGIFLSICKFAIEGKYKSEFPIKIEKFNSLTELQLALPKNFYYLDFEQKGIKETGNFKATKTSADSQYISYSVWYSIVYTVNGQNQERKLRVVAIDDRTPSPLVHELVKNTMIIYITNIEGYSFFFIIDGTQQQLNSAEDKYLVSIFELAIEGKYQIS